MKLMTMTIMAISIMYLTGSNPMTFMLLILIQSVMICILAWLIMKSSWISFILFLIFLGGLMVLFIYITSLASNDKISLNFTFSMFTIIMTLLMIKMSENIFQMTFPILNKFMNMSMFFNAMFNSKSAYVILVAMIYLLLTLIIAVKISNQFKAPIKNKIFN